VRGCKLLSTTNRNVKQMDRLGACNIAGYVRAERCRDGKKATGAINVNLINFAVIFNDNNDFKGRSRF
jgi:hypothetical protein